MRLNTLSPAPGRNKEGKRAGRGIGSGLGKTAGRGHKGQASRTGGSIRPGFEGGQMPLQKRLPKFGFTSRLAAVTAEIRLSELDLIEGEIVDIDALRNAGLINNNILRAKVFASGEVTKAVTLKGIGATKGAIASIEAAGGKVEE
ncbi:50S ribosomal protein L15 [Porticoccaceae bacterium]|jgi:large subunit ribosomal protein L15|nr:50S ribosomal protein L15 [Porticoccaceae bacterium]MDA8599285.1 50S ribosomal protein L15 [Porticoccaceae bacterium]MDA9583335.1 50S ribosomal protein L15 [Porticoccaceae bacterium]MDB2400801.1 50S ribosomal protein L15 [Porticoccaceae bacterium]MDB2558086.1 50S ribosomal protein L15 [Porticoccaceae bacterium]|tara:strand:- start:405 stop:839 length:435 start_codon:yes stop_codon:yes gene_type:complete